MGIMPKTRRKIKVRRKWGKDIGSDILKFHILSHGGFDKFSRWVGKRILKRKLPPPSEYERLTDDYQRWFAKKHKRKKA